MRSTWKALRHRRSWHRAQEVSVLPRLAARDARRARAAKKARLQWRYARTPRMSHAARRSARADIPGTEDRPRRQIQPAVRARSGRARRRLLARDILGCGSEPPGGESAHEENRRAGRRALWR